MLKNSLNFLLKVQKFSFVPQRFAGHSKWQNIRHIKGEKDAQRSKLFTKLSMQIKVAVQEGGGSIDPKLNLKLSQLLEEARRANMPNNTVQSILKSCRGDKSQCKSSLIEIKGPGSCFIICEVYTDKLHSLKMNMASILRKHGSKFNEKGAMHLFEEKGIIHGELADLNGKNEKEILEKTTEDAIEAGAEDVKILENNWVEFSCAPTNLSKVVNELEKIGYKISSASAELTPTLLQSLSEEELKLCEKLFEKLETLPEVVRIADNIA